MKRINFPYYYHKLRDAQQWWRQPFTIIETMNNYNKYDDNEIVSIFVDNQPLFHAQILAKSRDKLTKLHFSFLKEELDCAEQPITSRADFIDTFNTRFNDEKIEKQLSSESEVVIFYLQRINKYDLYYLQQLKYKRK